MPLFFLDRARGCGPLSGDGNTTKAPNTEGCPLVVKETLCGLPLFFEAAPGRVTGLLLSNMFFVSVMRFLSPEMALLNCNP